MAARDAYYDGTYKGTDRSSQVYSDIDLFFGPKIGSKDISKLTDFTAVKRSVRNLVLTNFYEKPFHPEIEPRAILVGVRATPNLDNNAYNVAIEFYVVNAPTELVNMEILLERLR